MTTAQRDEAAAALITVEYDGATYEIPPSAEWDIAVLEAIEDGKVTHAARALLGAVQYECFRAGHKKIADLSALMEVIGNAVGTGNS